MKNHLLTTIINFVFLAPIPVFFTLVIIIKMDILKKFKLWPFTNFFELVTIQSNKIMKRNDRALPYVTDPCTILVKIMAMIPLYVITWICLQIDPL